MRQSDAGRSNGKEVEAAGQDPPVWRRSALLRLVADRLRATRENRNRIQNHLALYRGGAPGFRAVQKSLERIANLSREKGVPFVVVLFPMFANPLDERYPFSSIHEKMATTCRSVGATFVDLLPYYLGMDWRLLVVEGARDEHPNELAHRIAAQALVATLDSALKPSEHHSPASR